jgi:molecular chaperone HtpG
MADQSFRVDLRGVVDLLSRYLYSSPRIYVRELLQNAVDAVTMRRTIAPDLAGQVRIEPVRRYDEPLRIHDNGIGLTESELHELLATIGGSSKRDRSGHGREDFLGQFGIGLLSCFVVADEIQVVSRSARTADAPTVVWTGFADGRYRVGTAVQPREEPGTTVTLTPSASGRQWLTAPKVLQLAREFGALLPVEITVGRNTVNRPTLPWQDEHASAETRRAALLGYGRQVCGFTPLDVIDLDVPEADLTGVAFVLPTALEPARNTFHRVYLKRMLLADDVRGLLPGWTFFVRAIVDSGGLRPTASREALVEDELLRSVRESLGEQVRGWLTRLAVSDPALLSEFVRVHWQGVTALAVHDDDMLALVDRFVPFDTSVGHVTLEKLRGAHRDLRFTSSTDEFERFTAVVGAQDLALVNAGVPYVPEILGRLPLLDPTLQVLPLEPTDLTAVLGELDEETDRGLGGFLDAARRAMDPVGCTVLVRQFDPPSLPALYLASGDAGYANELRTVRRGADELWGDVLESLDTGSVVGPRLVLNHRNTMIRRLVALDDPALVETAMRTVYGQTMLRGRHRLRDADTALFDQALADLLDRAAGRASTGAASTEAASTGARPADSAATRPEAAESGQATAAASGDGTRA